MKQRRKKIGTGLSLFLSMALLFLLFLASTFFLVDRAVEVEEGRKKFEDQVELRELYHSFVNQTNRLCTQVASAHAKAYNARLGFLYQNDEFNSEWKVLLAKHWMNRIEPVRDSINILYANIDSNVTDVVKKDQLKEEMEFLFTELNSFKELQLISATNPELGIDAMIDGIQEDQQKIQESVSKIQALAKIGYDDFDHTGAFSTPYIIIGLFLVAIVFVLVYTYLKSRTRRPMRKLEDFTEELSKGELPEQMSIKVRDYQTMAGYLNKFSDNLKNIQEIAKSVGKGQFDHDIKVFNDKGELGQSLRDMKESLKKVAEEDNQRIRVNEGLAKFSEILGNYTNDLEKFGDEVIFNLVKFLDANQGGLFVVNDETKGDEFLELVSAYAYNKKKFIEKKIYKGQGLAGQAWQEGKRIYLTEVPENYVRITSGLGFSTPRSVLIIPLNFNDETHGVIEIASFNELEQYELDFVEKAGESIASALASVKVNDKTQQLLNESKELTEQMRAQEEEMRQNMEELQATQEEMQRREEEDKKEIARLKKELKNLEANS